MLKFTRLWSSTHFFGFTFSQQPFLSNERSLIVIRQSFSNKLICYVKWIKEKKSSVQKSSCFDNQTWIKLREGIWNAEEMPTIFSQKILAVKFFTSSNVSWLLIPRKNFRALIDCVGCMLIWQTLKLDELCFEKLSRTLKDYNEQVIHVKNEHSLCNTNYMIGLKL